MARKRLDRSPLEVLEERIGQRTASETRKALFDRVRGVRPAGLARRARPKGR